MIRARFLANAPDYRPVQWPVKHPYWCTGTSERNGGERSVLVAYADSEEEILANWPEAEEIDSEEVDGYTFTSRFPKPDWFQENDHGIESTD